MLEESPRLRPCIHAGPQTVSANQENHSCFERLALLWLVAAPPSEPAKVRKILIDFPNTVWCVAFSPEGKTLATSTRASLGDNNALRLWDVASGKGPYCLGNYRMAASALVITPDGKTLITNGSGRTLHLWDLARRKVRLVVKNEPGIGMCLAVSRDSKLLAAAGQGERAAIRDLRTGKELVFIGDQSPHSTDPAPVSPAWPSPPMPGRSSPATGPAR